MRFSLRFGGNRRGGSAVTRCARPPLEIFLIINGVMN